MKAILFIGAFVPIVVVAIGWAAWKMWSAYLDSGEESTYQLERKEEKS